MSDYKEITTGDLSLNPFKRIAKDWMLITAEKAGKANTMTAGWGGLGVMWGKDVAFIVIRESRFTREFVDSSEHFSLTFFDEGYKKELGYLGSVSGRDEDKIARSGLTLVPDTAPYFKEGNLALICKKLYALPMGPEGFTAGPELDEKWYADKDYHTLYVGEIEKALIK
ncbi:flavin reductase [Eubacterium sp. 1001713B170207_170306_E7]|uniref:flavin reductase n=1 Tax=Eubacterium sp. 1001713B170207_170306_E7 TaxID=2787097 RepID=UPI00189BFC06|nr:flavin reductase [Eubacterium sp. 1001713B170207_170306_E7]